MLEEQRNEVYEAIDDPQIQIEAFSHIKKNLYSTKVFCWIQQGNTSAVIKFFNTFPHLINKLQTPNHWDPLMYAVRYGNLQLIQFLYQKGMRSNVQRIYNHASIVHCAVYSGDVQILYYVLNHIYKSANPTNCQISPLKIAMKIGNSRMVELLIAKGAYYTFGDVFNNLIPKEPTAEECSKYTTIDTARQIYSSLVVEDIAIKGCPIKQTLRWARIRQAMILRNSAQKMSQKKIIQEGSEVKIKEEEPDQQKDQVQEQLPQKIQVELPKKVEQNNQVLIQQKNLDQNHKFYGLSRILLNDEYYKNILKVLINKGDSILIKNDPIEEKEPREQAKDQNLFQTMNSQAKK